MEREINWDNVRRVLVVKLRSIGDTVLSTPSLIALKRFAPEAKVDILLEDWVAPVLHGFDAVDEVITVGSSGGARARTAWQLRRRGYDIAFNLHGGTTASFFTLASGARHRVGYKEYQYGFLYDHLLTSSADFWGREKTHSAEQQLALIGSLGVPVDDRPRSRLTVTDAASRAIDSRLDNSTFGSHQPEFALFHPTTAFFTKQWAPENFARVAEHLHERNIKVVAIASASEAAVLKQLTAASKVPVVTFDDLTLPEITALASRARLFVGNDSGIAHIAAAVNTPSVVIFGSSNRDNWYPWTDAPNEIVFEEFACQPCPGYTCDVYGEPRCVLSIRPAAVFAAIDGVLSAAQILTPRP